MKCIINTSGKIRRVSNTEAQKLTQNKWKFCPRWMWKKANGNDKWRVCMGNWSDNP